MAQECSDLLHDYAIRRVQTQASQMRYNLESVEAALMRREIRAGAR
jgi:hypothetical protein